MFLRGHDIVDKRAAQRSISSNDLLCTGVEVADCVFVCIASAALSSLLTCSAFRYQRRKGRCRNTGQVQFAGKRDQIHIPLEAINTSASQKAEPKKTGPPSEPRAMMVADCEPTAETKWPATHSDCQHVECKTAQEVHRAVSSQVVHTEEALQDVLHEKVCGFALFCYSAVNSSRASCISLSRRCCYTRCMIRSSYWQIASNSLLVHLHS